MFDHVILLTGPGERSILAARLIAQRPGLKVISAGSKDELLALDGATLASARLISFVTSAIVPASVLARLGYGAYNFHPGPPDYPGLSPAQFALYDGARSFGATVHGMIEAVDAGPIVAVAEFVIPDPPSLEIIETMAFQHLARLFWDMTPALVSAEALPETNNVWGRRRSTKRSTEAMCAIPSDIAAAELHRRVAAFASSPFGLRPTVTLHGYRFRLELDQIGEQPLPARTENTAVPSAA